MITLEKKRRFMKMQMVILVVGLFCLTSVACFAGDWANWRGPNFDGSTDETGLATTWSTTENVVWKTPLPGVSGATPIVVGDRIYLSSSQKRDEALHGMCLDRMSGKVIWDKVLAKSDRSNPRNTMASPSPVIDGERAIFLYGTGDLVALNAATGDEVWRRNLETEYGPISIMWLYGSSPLIHKGKLYALMLRNERPYRKELRAEWEEKKKEKLDSYLLCMNPATGKILWKHVRPTAALDESAEAYSTPIPAMLGGREEILITGGDMLTGHDPATGKEFWRVPFNTTKNPRWRLVPSAVATKDLAFCNQPRGGNPMFAVKAGSAGTIALDKTAWMEEGQTSDSGTPLIYQGRMYYMQDSKKVLTCVDPKTGKILYEEKIGGKGVYRSSPLGADGKVYCMNERAEVVVVEAGDTFKELARIDMEGRDTFSSVIAAHGKLFIRTDTFLYCIGK